jgi:hypothetical protein
MINRGIVTIIIKENDDYATPRISPTELYIGY